MFDIAKPRNQHRGIGPRLGGPRPAPRFIDLFAGIGGMRRGFEAAGGACVFTSEWNRFAQQTYQANHAQLGDHAFVGDITQVPAADVPEHDLLLAGFPANRSPSPGSPRRTR